MSVVNVRVKFIRRDGYRDLRAWIADTNNVYVGRRGIVFIDGKRYPQFDSPFANPFRITSTTSREECINKYESYIRARLRNEPELRSLLAQLRGKRLGCWCAPDPCHADVLLRLINEL